MKATIAIVFTVISASQAFMVQPVMKVSGNEPASTTRADFTKFAGTTVAATLAVAAPALAKPGTAPKQNLFGVVGSDMNLGGGASSYVPESETYSPYSPYGDGADALYKKDDGSYMLKVKIDILKDSQKRIQNIPAFIEKKKWSEIRSILTSKAFNLRDAMNSLADGKPAAQGAAKVFFRDIEDVIYSTRVKDQELATKSYNAAQEHLTKYLSLI